MQTLHDFSPGKSSLMSRAPSQAYIQTPDNRSSSISFQLNCRAALPALPDPLVWNSNHSVPTQSMPFQRGKVQSSPPAMTLILQAQGSSIKAIQKKNA